MWPTSRAVRASIPSASHVRVHVKCSLCSVGQAAISVPNVPQSPVPFSLCTCVYFYFWLNLVFCPQESTRKHAALKTATVAINWIQLAICPHSRSSGESYEFDDRFCVCCACFCIYCSLAAFCASLHTASPVLAILILLCSFVVSL